MIDSFELMTPKIRAAGVRARVGVEKVEYGVVTLHRPSNVDDLAQLAAIVGKLAELSRRLPLVFSAPSYAPTDPGFRARAHARDDARDVESLDAEVERVLAGPLDRVAPFRSGTVGQRRVSSRA